MRNFKKIRNTFLKIALSVGLLYLVFTKIEFTDVWATIQGASPLYIALAVLAFVASQWLSSFRLLLYFRERHYHLSALSNHLLYLVGMFYNFFIPGGIGGDAYKVYILNKNFKWEVRKLTLAVLNDRLSGLIAILIWIQLFSLIYLPGVWKILVIPCLALTIWLTRLMLKHWFSDFQHIYFRSLLYSMGIQGLQLLCIGFILMALNTPVGTAGIYFLVFLGSTLLSVLSFSGIGVREWLFLKASEVFSFDPGLSVSTALLFSALTALISLAGVFFQFRSKYLKLKD